MPRVSAAHLEARREQILDAAQRCFARNGFHATSMHDVIAEAGLSVGALYRYFKSKDELRAAVAERAMGAIARELDGLATEEPPVPLAEVMVRVLDIVEARLGPYGEARIAVQAWAEAMRDQDLGRFVSGVYAVLRNQLTVLARRAQQAGHLSPGADAEAVGAALFTFLPGYLLQRLLPGGPEPAVFAAGLRTLLGSARV